MKAQEVGNGFKETVFWTQHGRSPHKLEAIVRASIELVQAQARQNSSMKRGRGHKVPPTAGRRAISNY